MPTAVPAPSRAADSAPGPRHSGGSPDTGEGSPERQHPAQTPRRAAQSTSTRPRGQAPAHVAGGPWLGSRTDTAWHTIRLDRAFTPRVGADAWRRNSTQSRLRP